MVRLVTKNTGDSDAYRFAQLCLFYFSLGQFSTTTWSKCQALFPKTCFEVFCCYCCLLVCSGDFLADPIPHRGGKAKAAGQSEFFFFFFWQVSFLPCGVAYSPCLVGHNICVDLNGQSLVLQSVSFSKHCCCCCCNQMVRFGIIGSSLVLVGGAGFLLYRFSDDISQSLSSAANHLARLIARWNKTHPRSIYVQELTWSCLLFRNFSN